MIETHEKIRLSKNNYNENIICNCVVLLRILICKINQPALGLDYYTHGEIGKL